MTFVAPTATSVVSMVHEPLDTTLVGTAPHRTAPHRFAPTPTQPQLTFAG
jgi:hypothetical protein